MTDRRALAFLVLLHLVVVAIVQPRGDFPLNDDWAFAQSARWLLDEGRLRLSDWVPMYLVPQTLAGAALASVFGFSFDVLRHLTQAVAVLVLVAAFAWFRSTGLDTRSALVASLVVAAFPAWPVLANSYMTDVYALAFALPAATFCARALQREVTGAIVAATLFAVVGSLQRQVVLAIPFAFMVAWLWTKRPLNMRRLALGIGPLALSLAATFVFQAYLKAGPGLPEMHAIAHGRVVAMAAGFVTNEPGIVRWVLSNVASIPAYLGLFAAGWLVWWGWGDAGKTQRMTVLVLAAIVFAIELATKLPPYRANFVMDAAGIGPLMLYDNVRGTAPLDRSAGWLWRAAGVAAAFGVAALAVAIAACVARVARAGRDADPLTVFLLALVPAYLGPFIVTDYFDRYLLFLLPFAMVLATRAWPVQAPGTARRNVALLWIAAAILLSAVATRDYFSWNRARWDAIREAGKLGGDADSIDGGFEYGGLTRFERRAKDVPEGKSWYWVKDDRYVVAFSKIEGYDEIESWKVPHWLPRSPAEIKLLRRKP